MKQETNYDTCRDSEQSFSEEVETKEKFLSDDEDDGRTFANMNIPGMPWYVEGDENRSMGRDAAQHNQMTDEELKMYRWAALKSALLIALIFGVVFFLFIAFCDFIWFGN